MKSRKKDQEKSTMTQARPPSQRAEREPWFLSLRDMRLRSCTGNYGRVVGLRAPRRGSTYSCHSCQPLLLLPNVEQLQPD